MARVGQKYNTVKTTTIVDPSVDYHARLALNYCQHLTPAAELAIERRLSSAFGESTRDGATDDNADPDILSQFFQPEWSDLDEPTEADLEAIEKAAERAAQRAAKRRSAKNSAAA